MKSWFTLLSMIVLFGPLSGCVTATVQQIREASTGMTADDSIVVLSRRNRPSQTESENDFVACVSSNISRGSNSVRVVEEQAFMDALFPWFEPRTAPMSTTDLPDLLGQPIVAERIRDIGLKYLVWVEGSTKRTAQSGSFTCSVAPGGGGCFGFLTWENDSSYEASVWNAHTGKTAGRVSSDAAGTSYMPALVVPIPIIARVRSSACNQLATQLKQFVHEES